MSLLDETALESSSVVANSRMNRDRGVVGINSYERELRFDPVEYLQTLGGTGRSCRWLDLCCGTGRALLEAAQLSSQAETTNIHFLGIDLVNAFHFVPCEMTNVRLMCASLHDWTPTDRFDLITCVHGLHYIGDKLRLIERAVSWLMPDGIFIASLDLDNLRCADGSPLRPAVTTHFKACGLRYDRHKHLLSCKGRVTTSFAFQYLGADDQAGPNYSGQEAVNSLYCPAN